MTRSSPTMLPKGATPVRREVSIRDFFIDNIVGRRYAGKSKSECRAEVERGERKMEEEAARQRRGGGGRRNPNKCRKFELESEIKKFECPKARK